VLDEHAHTAGVEVGPAARQIVVLMVDEAEDGEQERVGRELAQAANAVFLLF
jgi:hypothetical protein